jgi:hypothetical protein
LRADESAISAPARGLPGHGTIIAQWMMSKPYHVGLCQNRAIARITVKHVQNSFRETAQIETLIANLSRSVDILNIDIDTEEERARVNDTSDSTYPILARHLRARRDNLNVTITALQGRLQKEQPPESNYSESLAG